MNSIWNTNPPEDCIKLIRDKLKHDFESKYYDCTPRHPKFLVSPKEYSILARNRETAVKLGLVDEIYFDWCDKLK